MSWTRLAGQQFDCDFDRIGDLLARKSGGDTSGDNLRALDAQPEAVNQLRVTSWT